MMPAMKLKLKSNTRFPNADVIIHLDPISAVDENIIIPFEPENTQA